jgi:hypothetical protein
MSERERSTAPDDERLRALVTKLGESGLNVAGVASPVRYDELARLELRSHALAPGTRSIIVIGSGGGALWNALIDAIRVDPTRLSAELHPLDAFVQRAIEEADGLLGDGPRRWFFAAADASPALDFRVLGALAGLGARSRMGLLLHPEYGPWLGLRSLLHELSAERHAGGAGPLQRLCRSMRHGVRRRRDDDGELRPGTLLRVSSRRPGVREDVSFSRCVSDRRSASLPDRRNHVSLSSTPRTHSAPRARGGDG